jgi:predicted NAD-dependent protein-ADP-ribosyltransferase YbiA (DUF1768 family)
MKKIDSFTGEYRFLSNFFKSEIYLGDRKYLSVEHFYQAGKAKTLELHEYIRTAPTATEAMIRGHDIEEREDWPEIKDEYMKLGLILKFDIIELGDMLLDTGDAYLESEDLLGKLLMQVRDQVLERREKQVRIVTEEK